MRFNPLTTKRTVVALMLAGSFGAAHATNGYFSHGYGIKAKGMGGASVAMSDNAFAGANNPAAAAFAGKRWDLGVELFMPERSVERTMAGVGSLGKSDSRQTSFFIPEFGYNNMLSDKLAINLTVYGNGGMNTNYKAGEFTCDDPTSSDPEDILPGNAHCGTSKLGVNLEQLIVAPTIAYKIDQNHALGVSPLIVYQKFRAYGLQQFDNSGFSSSLGKVTNRGDSESNGIGVRVGYLGRLNDKVTLGASYAPKINMSKFSKYKGLFAEGGDFDIPENYTIGLAIQATPAVLVAIDHQRINYSGVDSIGNDSVDNVLKLITANDLSYQLGAKNGPGFGWKNIGVWKLGVQWQANQTWTLRAGYNRGDNPIRSRDVTFNMLAPGVIKEHYTLGATMNLDKQSEMSFFYMHAKNNSVKGSSLFNAFAAPNTPAMTEKIQMHQNSLGIQYSRKF